jgi:hypothetical protein
MCFSIPNEPFHRVKDIVPSGLKSWIGRFVGHQEDILRGEIVVLHEELANIVSIVDASWQCVTRIGVLNSYLGGI